MSDYIIIGSGSAGCVIAKRLTDAGHSVTVLEYGGSDSGVLIRMPAALSYPMNMSRYDWGFRTEPEPHLGGRVLACPRGKVIGGSSSINGMAYVRGHGCDYDYWAESGAYGWSYADVLPYFKRMESAAKGDDGWRGTSGELKSVYGEMRNPLFGAFLAAAQEAGYGVNEDYNGYRQEGFSAMQLTVFGGQRYSSSEAFLRPAMRSGKLRLITRAFVHKILFDGKRAIGVLYKRGGTWHEIKAHKEIIIAASAINSPKLLKLSGIGDSDELRSHGIEVLADRKGVGENLQDHLEIYLQMRCLRPVSLYRYLNPFSKARIFLQWLLLRRGLGASPQFEAVGFIRSQAGVAYPDIQYHFLPIAIRYDGRAAARCHGFQVHVGPMRSASRGYVRLRSAAAEALPLIRFNYMSQAQDWEEFRRCIRLTREILGQHALAEYCGEELAPGASAMSDSALDAFVRDNVESAYHPCGTCKMGAKEDAMAVVDSECRVIGVENLRVADSSIFPRIPNGNLNAPSIMVGDKASDHILGRVPLPRDNRGYWLHPQRDTKQR